MKKKLKELKELKETLDNVKILYKKYDTIMEEILPLFVKKSGKKITITTEIKIGNESYTIDPTFFTNGNIKSKNWKSTAMDNFLINFD
jgi:hypothetical protein